MYKYRQEVYYTCTTVEPTITVYHLVCGAYCVVYACACRWESLAVGTDVRETCLPATERVQNIFGKYTPGTTSAKSVQYMTNRFGVQNEHDQYNSMEV